MKCECGCGQETAKNRRLRQGHWVRTAEGIINNSAIGRKNIGSHRTPEQIVNLSDSKIKYSWSYSIMTPDLAYIIGTYLTDGYIFNHACTLELSVVHKDFADKFKSSIMTIQPDQHIHCSFRQPGEVRKQIAYRVTATNKRLCSWLIEKTETKSRIPQELLESDYDSRMACFTAIMDGDGGKNPYPYVATTFSWIFDAHILAESIELNPRDITVAQILPNGKVYRRFSLPKPFHFTAPQKN